VCVRVSPDGNDKAFTGSSSNETHGTDTVRHRVDRDPICGELLEISRCAEHYPFQNISSRNVRRVPADLRRASGTERRRAGKRPRTHPGPSFSFWAVRAIPLRADATAEHPPPGRPRATPLAGRSRPSTPTADSGHRAPRARDRWSRPVRRPRRTRRRSPAGTHSAARLTNTGRTAHQHGPHGSPTPEALSERRDRRRSLRRTRRGWCRESDRCPRRRRDDRRPHA